MLQTELSVLTCRQTLGAFDTLTVQAHGLPEHRATTRAKRSSRSMLGHLAVVQVKFSTFGSFTLTKDSLNPFYDLTQSLHLKIFCSVSALLLYALYSFY